jgi:hypothetical protein
MSQFGASFDGSRRLVRSELTLGSGRVDEQACLTLSHVKAAQRVERHAQCPFPLGHQDESHPVLFEVSPLDVAVGANHRVDRWVRRACRLDKPQEEQRRSRPTPDLMSEQAAPLPASERASDSVSLCRCAVHGATPQLEILFVNGLEAEPSSRRGPSPDAACALSHEV